MREMDVDDGVTHLQNAAREMVAAARSFLDAVERVIDDDERLAHVVSQVGDALKGAAQAVTDTGNRMTGEPPSSPVEHIDLD